jgi:pilus assembly protein Flp/PilA
MKGVKSMRKFLTRLVKEEEGQGMVEYGLIIALIAIAVIVAVSALGDSLTGIFERISGTVDDPTPAD